MPKPTFAERLKSFLDWLGRGHTVLQLVGGGAVATVLKAVLRMATSLPTDWIWAISLTVVAVGLAALGKWKRSRAASGQAEAAQVTAVPPAAEPRDVEAFYRDYDNRMLVETEELVRKQSEKYKAGPDRERFLIRYFASGFVIALFEHLWLVIYQSQVLLLEAVNHHSIGIDDARPLYDSAKTKYPAAYATYSFYEWLGFLKNALLVVEKNGTIGITVRGKEFLKYLVHYGRSASDRSL